jgi:hypothetical protein
MYIIRLLSNTDNSNSNSKRGDPSQIPKGEEDVPADVQKVVSEEGGIEGQRKEVNVESYSKVASLGQILKDLEFPASKNNIVQFVQQKSPNSDLISALKKLQDRQYQNVSGVTKSVGLVY